MRRNTRAILLLAVLFLLLVGINFFFFVDNRDLQENEQTGNRSSYRSTPYGTLAFYTLLEESGYPVTRLETPFTTLKGREDISTLVIIAPPPTARFAEEEFESLTDWVEAGNLLIVIDREIEVAVGDVDISTHSGSTQANVRTFQPTVYTRGVNNAAFSGYANRVTVDSHDVTYHMGDDRGAVLADSKAGTGRVVLLTDPFVVANNGIAEGDNVVLALNLFTERNQGRIAFDEYHHGYGVASSGGVMSYFEGTPVPWMLWQTALIALLIVYSYGRRFARPLPLVRERRTTNLEFVSSMANITRLARATDLAMKSVYSEFHKRLCRYSGLPSKTDTARLAAVAARRAKTDENELRRLLERCEEVAGGRPASDAELLQLVSRVREVESQLKL
jgi:hypothetical protein